MFSIKKMLVDLYDSKERFYRIKVSGLNGKVYIDSHIYM